MSESANSLEQRLCDAYRRQIECYERALCMIGQAADDIESDWTTELQTILDEVTTIERSSATDKQTWTQAGKAPGPELRSALDTLAERIQAVAGLVDRRLAALSERRQRLLPELEGIMRQRRMMQAYHQFGSHS